MVLSERSKTLYGASTRRTATVRNVSDALKHAPKKAHKKELGNAIGEWIGKAKKGKK
jgi:hypothetical protein